MVRKHLFTAKSDSGWCTVITIANDGQVGMNAGSGRIITLPIKDIRKIV